MGFATFCVYEFKSNLPPKIVTRKKKKKSKIVFIFGIRRTYDMSPMFHYANKNFQLKINFTN